MKRIVGALIGIFFILFGGANWCYGISMKFYDYCLVGVGITTLLATVIIVGVMYFLESPRDPKGLLLMSLLLSIFGTADTCTAGVHDVLIRPEVTSIQPWNPYAVTGAEVWGLILVLVVVGLIVCMARSSIKKSIMQYKGR